MANKNDMVAYRKKRKRKNLIYKISAVSLIVTGALIITLNAETIFEPLRGIASGAASTGGSGGGFPIPLSPSASYNIGAVGDSFLLLTDTYLYTYSADGKQLLASQHGYQSPVFRAAEKRILLYGHNSYEFSLYNKNSELYPQTTDERIVSAYLGDGGEAAVITSSQIYSSVIRVYNGQGELRYTRRFVDEEVNFAAFTGDGDIIAVTSGVSGGDISSSVYRLRTDSEEVVWKQALPANSWAFRAKINSEGGGVTVLCDNAVFSLDLGSGAELGSFYFDSGTLRAAELSDALCALALYDDISGKISLRLLDGFAKPLAEREAAQNFKKVVISGEIVYTLEGNFLRAWDGNFSPLFEKALEEEYDEAVIVGGNALLLGYEKVDIVSLK